MLECLEHMDGGEIFVPKIPSMNIMDLAKAVAPRVRASRSSASVRARSCTRSWSRRTTRAGPLEFDHYFAILPNLERRDTPAHRDGRPCPDGFRYGSDNNTEWLTVDGLRTMLKDVEIEPA